MMVALTALLIAFTLLYWNTAGSASASNFGKNLDSNWDSWRNLIRALVGEPRFTPVPSVDCQSPPQSGYPFCDPSLSPEQRATDLVSRLTLEEIIDQTTSIAPEIARLGVGAYNWRSNCLHGWSKSGGHWYGGLTWTVFAAPIGLGATFNPVLIKKVGQVTADEGRALHNLMLAHFDGNSTEAAGLNCFSPNVNLLRDPRWGRAQETFGEDPYLLSEIGAAYTHGLQEGDDPKYLKVAACAKHFAVHSGPEELRMAFRANVSLHDLYDTYLPAFKSQVLGAEVSQIMPAYSGMRCKYQPNGAPDAANPFLLKTVLRQQFAAPNISVVSDNGAIIGTVLFQKFASNFEEGAAVCINATTDLDLGFDEIYPHFLPSAVKDSLVSIETVKESVWRSFYLRFKLGDFDPSSMVPYQLINGSHLDTPANQDLNLQAARESIVLLKNTLETLPLSVDGIRKLAVIGPNANATQTLLSNYEGIPSSITSVLIGIEDAVNGSHVEVSYAPGCASVECPDTTGFKSALELVHDADYVVLVMGLDSSVEGEGHDRAQVACESVKHDILALPGCQTELVEEAIHLNSRVILVLINGGPLSPSTLYDHKGILGILEAFYPGAVGGTAVADVLFGKYNPAGRMPMTVYDSIEDVPAAVNYNMTYSPGRTYRYFEGEPLFAFGYGLSYTEFTYSNLMVSPSSVEPCDSIKVSFSVQNTGEVGGDEVIQVYVDPPKISGKDFIPSRQLLGFERVFIKSSVVHISSFELNPYLLSLVDEDGEHYLFPGQYTVLAGGSSDGAHVTEQFTISGSITNVKTCHKSPQCLAC